jgi:ABC-type glycerol-3-phosphate transport system permease component
MQRSRALTTLVYALIVVVSVWSLFPLLWGVSTSVKVDQDIFTSPPRWIPARATLEHYYSTFIVGRFYRNVLNSLFISAVATGISLVGGVLAAYSLARFRFVGNSVILVLILASMTVPGLTNLIPIYVMLAKLKLLSTYTGLILIYGGWGIPWTVWIMRGFFQSLPKELEDAARVDGCSRMQTLVRIILPISAPGIISTTIFLFLNNWNEYIAARTYLQAAVEKHTAPVKIFFAMHSTMTQNWGGLNAMSFISYLPVLLLFFFLSKYLIAGLTTGSSR